MRLITPTISYLKEVRAELKRVNWPSRPQTARFTAAVVLMSAAIGLFLGTLDFAFSRILQILLTR